MAATPAELFARFTGMASRWVGTVPLRRASDGVEEKKNLCVAFSGCCLRLSYCWAAESLVSVSMSKSHFCSDTK